MRFNDSSNKEKSLYHDALYWSGAQAVSYEIGDFTRNANFALDTFRRKVFEISGRWQYGDANDTTITIDVTDLISGQDNYTLDNEQLRVSRFRVKDKQGNWKTLRPVDNRDECDRYLGTTGEPEVYDKLGRSLLPLPVPDYGAAQGVELTYENGSNYFSPTDTLKEPGIPSVFHRYISLYSARDKAVIDNPSRIELIDTELQRMDVDLTSFFAYQDRDEKPRMTLARDTEFY